MFFFVWGCFFLKKIGFTGRAGATPETESRPSPQPGKEPGETSSVTEDDNSEDDSDSREAQYKCHHCFSTSNNVFKLFVLFFLGSSVFFLQTPVIGNHRKVVKFFATIVAII